MTGMSEEDLLRAGISASEVGLGSLTGAQKLAARLLPALGAPEDVDTVLGLEKGTTARWGASEGFKAYTKEQRDVSVRFSVPSVDYSRVLDQPRAEAARALVLDGASQIEAARKVGVSDRSVRNWMKEEVFQLYVAQLRGQREREEAAERDAMKRNIEVILSEGRVDAARMLVGLAKGGDPKAIASLLKALL
jgi:transposase-like protein